jgi:hypothetical protein
MKDLKKGSRVGAACTAAVAAWLVPVPCAAGSSRAERAGVTRMLDERPTAKPDLVREFGHQRIETYVGAAALDFVQVKRARDHRFAKAMDASAERLSKRGYKNRHLETVTILTDTRGSESLAQRIWEFFVPRVSAQVYGANGDEPINGLGIWSAWDDGDNSTWEGNAYFENYDSGQWYSLDNQLDVSSEYTQVRWADARDFEGRDIRTREGVVPAALGVRQLSAPTVCDCVGRGRYLPANCMLRTALDRSFVRCGIAAGGCLLSGPGYIGCVGGGCGGSIAWEFLAEAWRWGRDCGGLFG